MNSPMTEHPTDALLPCPFCGGEAQLEKVSPLSRLLAVYCNACEVMGEKQVAAESAILSWNTRTTPIDDEGLEERIAKALFTATYGGRSDWDASLESLKDLYRRNAAEVISGKDGE